MDTPDPTLRVDMETGLRPPAGITPRGQDCESQRHFLESLGLYLQSGQASGWRGLRPPVLDMFPLEYSPSCSPVLLPWYWPCTWCLAASQVALLGPGSHLLK